MARAEQGGSIHDGPAAPEQSGVLRAAMVDGARMLVQGIAALDSGDLGAAERHWRRAQSTLAAVDASATSRPTPAHP